MHHVNQPLWYQAVMRMSGPGTALQLIVGRQKVALRTLMRLTHLSASMPQAPAEGEWPHGGASAVQILLLVWAGVAARVNQGGATAAWVRCCC
jgi:hypothetical protein